MKDLLFLAHRIPYPPDKGEKIRAWHMLRHLAGSHRVHLGCFIDAPGDWVHVEFLRSVCADVACFGIDRRRQRRRSLRRLRPGGSLSAAYFDDPRLHDWVRAKLGSGIDRAFVYCSAMAPYVTGATGLFRVLDMVDVDSEKWRAYADTSSWPARLIWAREARTLLALERRAAAACEQTILVSQEEAERFASLAPESAERIGWIENGVDLEHFAPGGFVNPYEPGGPVFVFTGTMDYRPNVDAVAWFAGEVMPMLRSSGIGARFAIVGAHPSPAVRNLACDDIIVTGRVDDVRPYVAHATAAVAPLRIARGIQNKVLEAMAMAKPVVASPQAFQGVRARPGQDLLVADGADAFAARLAELAAGLHRGLGEAARSAMLRHYAWSSVLQGLDALLDEKRHDIAKAA